jgi:hypothetical protein
VKYWHMGSRMSTVNNPCNKECKCGVCEKKEKSKEEACTCKKEKIEG